jgi:CheY-like chemotaxis protein
MARILIADDEEPLRGFISRGLQLDGHTVEAACDGAEGREIYAWTSDVSRSTLGKGESTTFRTRLVSPPAEGRDVVVRFADRDSHATLTR